MKAVVTTGNGGCDKLEYRNVPIPMLAPGEALLQVLAAGVNNTEINTRIGWYSSIVITGTEDTAYMEEKKATEKIDGGWNEETSFPYIQGTDCCGRIVAVAPGGDESTIGQRALVRSIGADRVIERGNDIVDCIGENSVDVVIDNVAGSAFGNMLKVLKRGGLYVSSGAIAGPLVTLDMRTFYLKDLTFRQLRLDSAAVGRSRCVPVISNEDQTLF